MKIRRLSLRRFTSFEDLQLEFSGGVNAIIGENGTGKSHLLKLLYSLSEAIRRRRREDGTIELPSQRAGAGGADFLSHGRCVIGPSVAVLATSASTT